MNAADDTSPNSRIFTDFDKENLLVLGVGEKYVGEVGEWSVHRYGESDFVFLANKRDFPAIEVRSIDKIIMVLRGGSLGADEFKDLTKDN
jgi:hypothetical protein